MTATATEPAPDFPDWLGPMLVKELRQGLKARAFVLSFIALQIVLVVVVAYHALLYARDPRGFDPSGLNTVFWMLLGVQLIAITPLRAINALAGERKANTLELIFMSGLTPWRIALGKWASLLFQAALFVLAVLPYAIARYFFGGVNLAEELSAIGQMLLASAVLTAIALAVSGMVLFVRIAALIVAGLALTGILPMLLFMFFRPVGLFGGPSFSSIADVELWPVIIFDALLLGMVGLEMAAASIAPPAENHALRQRFIALVACLPVPLIYWWKAGDPDFVVPQIVFAAALIVVTCWYHLSAQPEPLRTHVEPFARRRGLGLAIGAFFQPGWPSAVLFLLLVEAVLLSINPWVFKNGGTERLWYLAGLMMAGAALLTPAFYLNLLRRRSKWPLAEHTLVHLICGGAAIFLASLRKDSSPHLGEQPIFAIMPPLGFWTMFDSGYASPGTMGARAWRWVWASLGAITLCAGGLLILSRGYWRQLWTIAREVRSAKSAAPESGTA